MLIIEYLQNLLKGRGFFASFLVISGWTYTAILVVVLICRIFLYLFGSNRSQARGE
jgi:hypothetical protein